MDEAGNKLQTKSVVMFQMTPLVITEEEDVDHFASGKMENIYHADKRYFDFLKHQVKELKAEKNQNILASMFRAFTGSRYRPRRRQVTGIPPMLVTSEPTPVSDLEVVPVATPPGLSKVEQIESAPEQLVPVPVVELHTQPSVHNQLGSSYSTEGQVC